MKKTKLFFYVKAIIGSHDSQSTSLLQGKDFKLFSQELALDKSCRKLTIRVKGKINIEIHF